jgi:hypothetical protein
MSERILYTPAAARWTPEDRETLDYLWREGVLAKEIGQRLGRTKNAIIAEAWRRELPPRFPPDNATTCFIVRSPLPLAGANLHHAEQIAGLAACGTCAGDC